MLQIDFQPHKDTQELLDAAVEYAEIWAEWGEKITRSMWSVTGLSFQSTNISAIVWERLISRSHPLTLRSSYSADTKLATLVHELLHILFEDNGITLLPDDSGIDYQQRLHQHIYLALVDIWIGLKGEEFAQEQIAVESQRRGSYKFAWEYVLSLSDEERKRELKEWIE